MNIQLLTPRFFTQKTNSTKNTNTTNNRGHYPNLAPLKNDTVSFGIRIENKALQNATFTLTDVFGKKYDDTLEMHKAMGTKLIDIATSIAEEVEGIEFSKDLYGKSAVKGKKSFLSKLRRSGAMPLDQVRTTLNMQDITNMSLFMKFVKAMNERGFELRMIPVKEGRKVVGYKPDLDIRRDDIPASEIAKLPKEFQECVSDRVPSGLGDIQTRWIDKFSKSKEPQEILIMTGDASGIAKMTEEDDIYTYMRSLKDELSLRKSKEESKDPILKRINDSISALGKILRTSISMPMYANAEAKDVTGKSLGLAVELTPESATIAKGFLNSIRSDIEKYYAQELKRLETNRGQRSIESKVKASTDYKTREDKTIYTDDMLEMKKEAEKQLKASRKADRELFRTIQAGLEETINKYTVNTTKD